MDRKILAIHDISCIGRCSLTVALPILSAAGLETSVLPTAVLSTHTGNFPGFTFRDLTEDIIPITNHWKSLNIKFKSIFTGYLGSYSQIELVSKIIDEFSSKNTFVMIDPVMGDDGKLYSNLTPDFAKGFRKLCSKAQVITPNLTEAALLLEMPYPETNYSENDIKSILKKLSLLGPEKIVLTGVSFDDNDLGCALYDASSDKYDFIFEKKVDGFYHGTGDVFSSSLLAGLMNNHSLSSAAAAAVGFTADAIKRTQKTGGETRYGVNFEDTLSEFAISIKQKK